MRLFNHRQWLSVFAALTLLPACGGESGGADNPDAAAQAIMVGNGAYGTVDDAGGGDNTQATGEGKGQGYEGPGDTIPDPPPETPAGVAGNFCTDTNPPDATSILPIATPDPQCVECSGLLSPDPDVNYLAYSYHVTLADLAAHLAAGELAPDSQGCVFFGFSVDGVKRLRLWESDWFNGSLSPGEEPSGVPIRLYVTDCEGNHVWDYNHRVDGVYQYDLYGNPEYTCQCLEFYLAFDALGLQDWLDALNAEGHSPGPDTAFFDVGVESCTPCESGGPSR